MNIKRFGLLFFLLVLTSTTLASGFAVHRTGTKVAPNTFTWVDVGHNDLNFAEGEGANSSRTDGNYNTYILGIGRWVLPNFMVGTAFLSTDGLYKNQLNTISTISGALNIARNDTHIRSTGFQPFMAYMFSKQLFMDFSGGFSWTNTDFTTSLISANLVNDQSTQALKGYNWNVGVGLNAIQPLPEQKLRIIGRVGYLAVSSHSNKYISNITNLAPIPVAAKTATRNSVIGSVTIKSFWMQSIRPFVRLDALYDFSIHPNNLVIVGQGSLPTPNLSIGRFMFNVRGGAEIRLSPTLGIRASYQYSKRNNLTQNAYLLNANLAL